MLVNLLIISLCILLYLNISEYIIQHEMRRAFRFIPWFPDLDKFYLKCMRLYSLNKS